MPDEGVAGAAARHPGEVPEARADRHGGSGRVQEAVPGGGARLHQRRGGRLLPDDLVINAGSQTLFIGGANGERTVGIGGDPPRVDPGDRRRGLYYFDLVSKGLLSGLQQVKKVPLVRLAELEKTRQIRTGERPADWILKARARSDEGKGPPVFEDKRTAMSELQRAATGVPDPEL